MERFYSSAVISSLGSAATGQFGSLGVSWNLGAPSLSSEVPPSQEYLVSGHQIVSHDSQHQDHKQTPEDDLGQSICVAYCV